MNTSSKIIAGLIAAGLVVGCKEDDRSPFADEPPAHAVPATPAPDPGPTERWVEREPPSQLAPGLTPNSLPQAPALPLITRQADPARSVPVVPAATPPWQPRTAPATGIPRQPDLLDSRGDALAEARQRRIDQAVAESRRRKAQQEANDAAAVGRGTERGLERSTDLLNPEGWGDD